MFFLFFPVQPSGTKSTKKVVLILCAGASKSKNFSIFSKKFAFTPLQNRNFRYNNHRPVCLCSSVGRAGDWKSPCHWFDSDRRHHMFCSFRIKKLQYAAVAHLVERHLAKVEVASSSLVGRSRQTARNRFTPAFCLLWWRGQVVRQGSAKPSFGSSNLPVTSIRLW